MEKPKITQYRERLDKTLASPELTNKETVKALVKNQLLDSSQHGTQEFSESLIDKKTNEVLSFLDMLRSASVNDYEASRSSKAAHGEWKLKQDNEDFRVMYREGPQGTPFHSLLVEGYVDGPVDACLCVSWESALYKKWWPEFHIPPFKVLNCKCVQKVRIGEQISLVRMKVPWPLSDREALLHFFIFEYFQDDLIVVLLNSISEVGKIDKATHGFTSDGIPEVQNVVRMDVMGGFAQQKVTPERSYFRTIATMDIKLDFVPPSLINFISRQLVGNGFRLYRKEVASISNDDEDFRKALKDPLYTRIRKALYSIKESKEVQEVEELESNACRSPTKSSIKIKLDEASTSDVEPVNTYDHTSESLPKIAEAYSRKALHEIEEEHDESTQPRQDLKSIYHQSVSRIAEKCHVGGKIKEENKENTQSKEDLNSVRQLSSNKIAVKCHVDDEIEEENEDTTYPSLITKIAMKSHANEITEEDKYKESTQFKEDLKTRYHPSTDRTSEMYHVDGKIAMKSHVNEITEEDKNEESTQFKEDLKTRYHPSTDRISEMHHLDGKKSICISPEVEKALGTLEKAISIIREYGFIAKARSSSSISDETPTDFPEELEKNSTASPDKEICSDYKVSVEPPNKEVMVKTSHELRSSSGINVLRLSGSNSFSRDGNNNRVAPVSPNQELPAPLENNCLTLKSSVNLHDSKQLSSEANDIHEGNLNGGKKLSEQNKHRFCCFR